jgi:hypothetical protein
VRCCTAAACGTGSTFHDMLLLLQQQHSAPAKCVDDTCMKVEPARQSHTADGSNACLVCNQAPAFSGTKSIKPNMRWQAAVCCWLCIVYLLALLEHQQAAAPHKVHGLWRNSCVYAVTMSKAGKLIDRQHNCAQHTTIWQSKVLHSERRQRTVLVCMRPVQSWRVTAGQMTGEGHLVVSTLGRCMVLLRALSFTKMLSSPCGDTCKAQRWRWSGMQHMRCRCEAVMICLPGGMHVWLAAAHMSSVATLLLLQSLQLLLLLLLLLLCILIA